MAKKSGESKRGQDPASKAALAEHGKATQFDGERANPQSQNAQSNKPWSIHNSIRYFSAQPVDEDETPVDEEARKRPMKHMLGRNPTRAERIALKAVSLAEEGDIRAMEFVTERVDGKVAQINLNRDLAALEGMSDDELVRIARGEESPPETGSGPDDPAAPEKRPGTA